MILFKLRASRVFKELIRYLNRRVEEDDVLKNYE